MGTGDLDGDGGRRGLEVEGGGGERPLGKVISERRKGGGPRGHQIQVGPVG